MYVPSRYAVGDDDAWAVVRDAGAGFLVVATNEGPRSVFAPMLANEDGSIVRLHVSRGNDLWRTARDGDEAVALFKIADSYVSPNLYPTKETDGRVAPTWDYAVVEVAGTVTVRDDVTWCESLVRDLSEHFESDQPLPWSLADPPRDFVDALLRGIVGLELAVTHCRGAAKLSQNQPDVNRESVRENFTLGTARERAVADAMDRLG